MASPPTPERAYGSWATVKAFVVVALVAVVCYKLIVTPFELKVDFSGLLSLLLALFSVGLAALFYFKATDTSNRFYDNTYKFTKDIADLLVRMESGFGERLRHLDEGYTSMRSYLETLPGKASLQDTKQELEQEEEELNKKIAERDKMIEDLASRAKLQERERQAFLTHLREKDGELAKSQQELQLLRRMIHRAEKKGPVAEPDWGPLGALGGFTGETLLKMFGLAQLMEAPTEFVARRFERAAADMPGDYLDDMKKAGFLSNDGRLTPRGRSFLHEVIAKLR